MFTAYAVIPAALLQALVVQKAEKPGLKVVNKI
jgi:hypothetical protein